MADFTTSLVNAHFSLTTKKCCFHMLFPWVNKQRYAESTVLKKSLLLLEDSWPPAGQPQPS